MKKMRCLQLVENTMTGWRRGRGGASQCLERRCSDGEMKIISDVTEFGREMERLREMSGKTKRKADRGERERERAVASLH